MKNAFASKVSYFILTTLFLVITASFLFSNFDKFSMGSSKDVATVDGTPITIKEFQTALSRQVEFFNQMMGGQMTEKQLQEMGVKTSVLDNLIKQKLVLNLADRMGFVVSLDEVKNEIKNMPYFKTKEQFDVNLYRNALQANGYTPAQFEELVGNDLRQKKIDELFNTAIVSDAYVNDVMKFKNNVLTVQSIKLNRHSMAPLVSVSEQEINDYLGKKENNDKLQAAYTDNLTKYHKPEEVKARHILIQGEEAKSLDKIKALKAKVTTKNFAEIASKETEDPTGKANGGELGWFSAGRMVPEFDAVAFKMNKGEISAPVKTQFGYHLIYVEDKKSAEKKTFEDVKKELARLEIQKTKSSDLDKLMKAEEERLTAAMKSNDGAVLESTAKKVEGQYSKSAEINQFDQSLGGSALSPDQIAKIYAAPMDTIVNLGNPGMIYLVKVTGKKDGASAPITPEALKAEVTNQNQLYQRKVRDEVLKALNNKAKVVTKANVL